MNKINYEYIEELDSYIKEIGQYQPLSRNEERELSERIKNGDEQAKEKLIKHNLRFVVNIAKNYRNRGVPFTDLIAEGNVGLIKAAEKFDADKDVKFISYAVWWIKNSFNECMKLYGFDKDKNINENSFVNVEDVFKDESLVNERFEEELLILQSKKDCVNELTKCLKDRELKIITLFYGLNNGKEMTLEEVGSEMNLTMERVRQIKDTAITKLKCSALMMNKQDLDEVRAIY